MSSNRRPPGATVEVESAQIVASERSETDLHATIKPPPPPPPPAKKRRLPTEEVDPDQILSTVLEAPEAPEALVDPAATIDDAELLSLDTPEALVDDAATIGDNDLLSDDEIDDLFREDEEPAAEDPDFEEIGALDGLGDDHPEVVPSATASRTRPARPPSR